MDNNEEHERNGSEVHDDFTNMRSDLDASNNDGPRHQPAVSLTPRKAPEQDTISTVGFFKDNKIEDLSSRKRRNLE